MGGAVILDILLRGLAVGGFGALGLTLWRGQARRSERWAALLACLAAAGYASAMCEVVREALGPLRWAAIVLAYGVNAYVWQFVLVVFADRKIGPLTLAGVAAVTALGLYGAFGPVGRDAAELARDALSILLGAHAMAVVLASWRDDLVEARRRLRGPFFGVVSAFIIAQTLIDALIRYGLTLPWRDLVNSGFLALLAVLGAAAFLAPRPGLFAPADRKARPRTSHPDLERLTSAMEAGEIWRREGLTIGLLTQATGVPEHRLRRLINDQLGHRNFAAFVNARRIAAARAALGDPAQARKTIAQIAYELGFGSLGPFNRAFRAEVGTAPREWRRRALAGESLTGEGLAGESLAETSKTG